MDSIRRERVLPVAVIDDAADAVPLARALLAGGLSTLELTLRTPAAIESIRRIRAEMPAMQVGAGTVLSTAQVDAVIGAGACFAVAPGMNRRVVAHALERNLPFFPGVMTPSDVEAALELGCTLQKFFPASVAGGVDMIKALAGPYGPSGVSFIPLGGITPGNMAEYLAQPLVAAIGGSWLADKTALARKDWDLITELASEARAAAEAVTRSARPASGART